MMVKVKVAGVVRRSDGSCAIPGEVLEIGKQEIDAYGDALELILEEVAAPQVDRMMRGGTTK